MASLTPLLAHALSPENPWIGPMTVASVVLLVTFALVLAGRVEITAPGDLLLPLAAAALLAGLAGSAGDLVLDQGRWAVPAGVVVLVALLLAAFREVDYSLSSRSTLVVVVAAIVAAAALFVPLDRTWFPQEEGDEPLPVPEDAAVTAEVLEPLTADGRVVVRVALEGATFSDNVTTERPGDAETLLRPRVQVGPVYLQPPIPDACAAAQPCTEADFELTLPEGFVSDPPETLVIELLTADLLPFAPPVQTRIDLPVAP